LWAVPPGWIITTGQGTNSINVTVGTTDGNVMVTPSNSCGNGTPRTMAVNSPEVLPSPGNITGNVYCCLGAAYNYSIAPVSGATSYTWTYDGGGTTTGTGTSCVLTPQNSGDLMVVANINNCSGAPSYKSVSIVSVPPTPGTINGAEVICNGTITNYHIDPVAGALDYEWSFSGGGTPTGMGNNCSLTPTSSGTLAVRAHNTCGYGNSVTKTLTILEVPDTPGIIISTTSSYCSASTESFTINPVTNATDYSWTFDGEGTLTGSGTSCTLTPTSSGTLSVLANGLCGNSGYSTLSITLTAIPTIPDSIMGMDQICAGSSYGFATDQVIGATDYTWSYTGSATLTQNGLEYCSISSPISSGILGVTANNSCGSSPARTFSITLLSGPPSTPDPIMGDGVYCSGSAETFSITPVANANFYNWSYSGTYSSFTSTGTSCTLSANSGGYLSVRAMGVCGVSDYSTKHITLTLPPSQPTFITSPTPPYCENGTYTFSTPQNINADSYLWTYSETGTVSGTGNTCQLTPVVDGILGVAAQNTCGTSLPRTRTVTVTQYPPMPSPIVGDTTPCEGMNTYYRITGGTAAWTVPATWTILNNYGNKIFVYVGSFSGGEVTAKYENVCGYGPERTLAVSPGEIPEITGGISGYGSVCWTSTDTVTYSVEDIPGATYMWWTPPGFDIVGPSDEHSIDLAVDNNSYPGDLRVRASLGCGFGPEVSRYIDVLYGPPNYYPESILGPRSVCVGDVVFFNSSTITNDVYYWTVPSGWTIQYGQGTPHIKVLVGTELPGGGHVSVSFVNNCGAGGATGITVFSFANVPAIPVFMDDPVLCANSARSIAVENVLGTTYNWTLPSGWTADSPQGQNWITVTTNNNGGNVVVTPSNGCGTGPSLTTPLTVEYPITTNAGQIIGPEYICTNEDGFFSINPPPNARWCHWSYSDYPSPVEDPYQFNCSLSPQSSGILEAIPGNNCGTGSPSYKSIYYGPCYVGCGAYDYQTVTNPSTGRTWLNRNLGTDVLPTQEQESSSYLFQWGRGCDGHQDRNSQTTTVITSNTFPGPGHDKFVLNWGDWTSLVNNSLWQGVSGPNNPCPTGFRLPTKAEFDTEIATFSPNTATGAFNSPLKWTRSGWRRNYDGQVWSLDGHYWTSTIETDGGLYVSYSMMLTGSLNYTIADKRGHGKAVRCIQD